MKIVQTKSSARSSPRQPQAGANAVGMFNMAMRIIDLPRTAIYHPNKTSAALSDWQADWLPARPVAAVLFYRSHLQAANTAFIDEFCQRLQVAGARHEQAIAGLGLSAAELKGITHLVVASCTGMTAPIRSFRKCGYLMSPLAAPRFPERAFAIPCW